MVGVFVIYTGLRVLRETSLDLMDTMPNTEFIERIRVAAMQVSGVRGVEKCFARKTGLQHHVDIHVEVSPRISVAESHEIAPQVRTHVRDVMPEVGMSSCTSNHWGWELSSLALEGKSRSESRCAFEARV